MRAAAIAGAYLVFAVGPASSAELAAADAGQPLLRSIASEVKPGELKATIDKLVSFGTRHTLSDTRSETRGIGAARRWVKARFREIGRSCGGCLDVEMPEQAMTSNRVPTPTPIVDVIAIQRGTSDPNRVIIIQGHLDSRVTDPMNSASDAPGANDDASGVAAVIEAARVLSRHKFPATLVYAALTGEEQGLLGGKVLAQYALDRNWQVEAVLNNDIVGSSARPDGTSDLTHVRVFSEGTRSIETQEEANRRRYNGGEVDSPSRNLARYISDIAERYLADFHVRMIYRTDRFGRGGDQVPMLAAGFPAVRFTEAVENYNRQHQDLRIENGIDYGDVPEAINAPYLAQVARLNAVTMASLAMAPAPPSDVKIEGAVSYDTKVSWAPVARARSYKVWRRDTTAPAWTDSVSVAAPDTSITLKNVNIDDWLFGTSSVSKDGYESPVVFPGPAGAFFPPRLPPAKP